MPSSGRDAAPGVLSGGTLSPLAISLISGGVAGTCVDIALFPLDTLKTRLQHPLGFQASGGFRGVYAGLGSAVLGSAPSGALFFMTYDLLRRRLAQVPGFQLEAGAAGGPARPNVLGHLVAASLGEVAACLVRVPTDNLKQNIQAAHFASMRDGLAQLARGEGLRRGLFRGYASTIARDVPFTCVQFPLYDWLKRRAAGWRAAGLAGGDLRPEEILTGPEMALCGALAGATAAGVSTPLDVAKSRIILHDRGRGTGRAGPARPPPGALRMLWQIYHQEGGRVLFRGVVPRVLWIGVGGSIFLGIYEQGNAPP
ncbi:hypothetical protein H696_01830 [Fonticula alba]|uniref:S-adenosylmethionine mitochondrial carrier protein n=1 Tax=Fonticula alba TaxID=691883 RepID=A0A058ZA98_FONAL|nr:hypothetical protein H696_01830 [Fonticula alba]KCV70883.1 hypothetical protein H696_01830 [Fonticula alba]|eukprot:XP_009494006.1 hypothetical protein H696_01830 [Fonticula alba]